MYESFKIIKCEKCGKEGKALLDDDGACGDPECCGYRTYYYKLECSCGETTNDYDL